MVGICFALLALQSEIPSSDRPMDRALGFLVRHQGNDGSWGGKPPACTCPLPPPRESGPRDEKTRETIAHLIERLADEDFESRCRAQADLLKTGPAAIPQIRQASRSADPEVHSRCRELLLQMALPDERSDIELTGLTLLVFLSLGYTHLAKDGFDGRSIGDAMRGAFKGLMKRQRQNGSFEGGGPEACMIVTVALTEAYGLTGSNLFKDEAARAIEYGATLKATTARETAWKAFVLHSAQACGLLEGKKQEKEDLAAFLLKQGGDWDGCGRILMGWDIRVKDPKFCNWGIAPSSPGLTRLIGMALYQSRPWTPVPWKEWRGTNAKSAFAIQVSAKDACERGSWDGDGLRRRIESTLLRLFALTAFDYPYDR